MFTDQNLYNNCLLTLYLIGPPTFIALQFLTAPYGKHNRSGWGPSISPPLAWFLMESPTLWLTLFIFPFGHNFNNPLSFVLISPYLFHYFNRTIIYPFKLYKNSPHRKIKNPSPENQERRRSSPGNQDRRKTKNGSPEIGFPVSIALMAFGFNILNAYVQARWVSHYADFNSDKWFWARKNTLNNLSHILTMASSVSSLNFLFVTPQTLSHAKPNSISTSLPLFSLPSSSLKLSLTPSCSVKPYRFVSKVALSEFDQDVEVSDQPNFSSDLKLFVGNLPYSVDSAALAALFERAGNVEMVEVIYDKLTGRSRGFGFVTMSTSAEVEAAEQQFNGYEIDGRAMRVNAGPPPPKGENSSFGGGARGGRAPDSTNRVYVGNLSWGVDDLSLKDLFSEQGNVVDARVVYDRDSGRSKGFGFVTYSSAEEVNNAVESLNGVDLDGRSIRVSPAEARPPRRQF